MNTTTLPARQKSRATLKPSNIVPFLRPLPTYTQLMAMDRSKLFCIPIPLTQKDADAWSRVSRTRDQLIIEWGLETLRNAVTGTDSTSPESLPLPSRDGNLWNIPLTREDAANITKQAVAAGMTTTQWAYSTLAAAWKGGAV